MKTLASSLLALAAFSTFAGAEEDLPVIPQSPIALALQPATSQAPQSATGSARLQPVQGLQPASGLALATLGGRGPGPVAVRLSDDQWRQVFPVRKPARR